MGSVSIIGDEDYGRGYYGSDSATSVGLGINGITVKGRTKTYGTYQEMLNDKQPGKFAYVIDASGDSTVHSGFAYYAYEEGIWRKLFEQEVMDLNLQGHNHTNMEILEKFGIAARRPTFDGIPLAYKTELDKAVSRIESKSNKPSQFRYEFIDVNTHVNMEEKTYIIRGCRFIGVLPEGLDTWEEVCYRLVVDELAATKGGAIVPKLGDTINGVSSPFYLSRTMDVRIIYDRKHKDWVVIGTLI